MSDTTPSTEQHISSSKITPRNEQLYNITPRENNNIQIPTKDIVTTSTPRENATKFTPRTDTMLSARDNIIKVTPKSSLRVDTQPKLETTEDFAPPKRREKKTPRQASLTALTTQEGVPNIEPPIIITETVNNEQVTKSIAEPAIKLTPRSNEAIGMGVDLQIKITKVVWDFSPLIPLASPLLRPGVRNLCVSIQLQEPSYPAKPPQFGGVNSSYDQPAQPLIQSRSKKFRTDVIQISPKEHDSKKPITFESSTFLFHLLTTKRSIVGKKDSQEELILFDLMMQALLVDTPSNSEKNVSDKRTAQLIAQGHLMMPNVVETSKVLLAGQSVSFLIDLFHDDPDVKMEKILIGRVDVELSLDGVMVSCVQIIF